MESVLKHGGLEAHRNTKNTYKAVKNGRILGTFFFRFKTGWEWGSERGYELTPHETNSVQILLQQVAKNETENDFNSACRVLGVGRQKFLTQAEVRELIANTDMRIQSIVFSVGRGGDDVNTRQPQPNADGVKL